MKVGDFLGLKSKNYVVPTYRPGVTMTDISKCLPSFVTESIRIALPKFEKKIKNFANVGNVLTAIETRSSCPIQVIRNENKSTNISGLFAIGEGAGYAGGIMSAAVDGINVAINIMGK